MNVSVHHRIIECQCGFMECILFNWNSLEMKRKDSQFLVPLAPASAIALLLTSSFCIFEEEEEA